jgi:hypothetical protein
VLKGENMTRAAVLLGIGIILGLLLENLSKPAHGQEQSVPAPSALQAAPADSLKELMKKEKPTIERVAGAAVYKLPLISKVSPRTLELFPHYKPRRAAAGWLHAYIEPATPTACSALVEEIPPHTTKLVGRTDTGYYSFFAVSGKGYTEFRADPSKPGKGVVWGPNDLFHMPWGEWYGHANPFDEPARIVTFMCHLDHNDLLNPYLARTRTVPEFTFVGERRDPVPDDLVEENVDWNAVKRMSTLPAPKYEVVTRGPAKTPVFQGHIGTALDMGRMEWPLFYKIIRGQEGWRGGHEEPGDDIGWRSYFTVLEEISPKSSEIGHKHGGGLWFLVTKGKGYMALRASIDAPEARINWSEGDMWVMPWMTGAGTWHSHANPYDEPARFITAGQVIWDNDGLLNGKISRVYHISGDGVNDSAPDNVFRKRGEAPAEGR